MLRSPDRNPEAPKSGELRVLRGGGWVYSPTYLRAAYRIRYQPDNRNDDIGFRCVREVFP